MKKKFYRLLILIRKIKTFFLIFELRATSFLIGGYKDSMVYTGDRYLEQWEVKVVHKLRTKGKVIFSHQNSITSPNTGIKYTDDYFKLSK
jgi:hypothetical protein